MGALIVGPKHGTLNLSPRDPNLSILMNLPNLAAFFDPDWEDGLTLRESGGTQYVTAMLDRTEQHVVEQPTEGNQPVLAATLPSGRMAMTFAAGDAHHLRGASALATGIGAGSFTVFSIAKFDSLTATRGLWSFGNVSNARRSQAQAITLGAMQFTRFEFSQVVVSSANGSVTTSGFDLWTFLFDAGTSTGYIRKNGVQVATGTLGGSPTFDVFGIGTVIVSNSALNIMDGKIGPTLVCSSVLGGSDLTGAEAALISRYAEAA